MCKCATTSEHKRHNESHVTLWPCASIYRIIRILKRTSVASHYHVLRAMVRTFTTESGKSIQVGENAGENQRLCKEARQNDEWFHLDGGPSPHVILQNQGKPMTRDEIHDCAQLVKHYSKQKYVLVSFAFIVSAQNTNNRQLGAETQPGCTSRTSHANG